MEVERLQALRNELASTLIEMHEQQFWDECEFGPDNSGSLSESSRCLCESIAALDSSIGLLSKYVSC